MKVSKWNVWLILAAGTVLAGCASPRTQLGDAGSVVRPGMSVSGSYGGGPWGGCNCMAAPKEVLGIKSIAPPQVFILDDVLFDFNRATLLPASREVISKVAAALHKNPQSQALVKGHTDDVGSDAYNMRLSRRRAESVHNALVDTGISPTRVDIEFYGEKSPVAANDSERNRQRNRRVEIIVQ